MLTASRRALAAFFVALAASCGGKVVVDGAGVGGASASSTSSTSSTSSSSGQCAGFDDATGTPPVTLRFVNQTGLAIYLETPCGYPRYDLAPASGADGTSYWYGTFCMQTCAERQTHPKMFCGGCPALSLRVDPGGTRDVVWSGEGLAQRMMPAACFDGDAENPCEQLVAAPHESFVVSATAYASCPSCSCSPDGSCAGGPSGQTATSNPVTFSYPASGPVEIVFPACAFGCP